MIALLSTHQIRLLASLTGGPPEIRDSLPPEVVARLDALIRRGRMPAVVEARAGCCSGCHLRLPAALAFKVGSVSAAFSCPACHRILYDPVHLSRAAAAAPDPPRRRRTGR